MRLLHLSKTRTAAPGAALAGRAEKKPRRGRGRSPQADAAEDAEDAIFDPGNDAASTRQDAEAQPMKIEHTVVVADIISTVSRRSQGCVVLIWRPLPMDCACPAPSLPSVLWAGLGRALCGSKSSARTSVAASVVLVQPPQPQQPETPNAIGSGSPNFKRFRKQLSSEGRRPLIPFAAASYAQEVGAQDFIR